MRKQSGNDLQKQTHKNQANKQLLQKEYMSCRYEVCMKMYYACVWDG